MRVPRRAAAWAAVGACGAAALLTAWLYHLGALRLRPDRARYPVRGVDVSNHQGDIRWDQAANDDVAFAYIKASEGGDFRDRRFSDNWRAAARAGVRVGAYHFFTFCREGEVQAQNFLGALAGLPEASLPPAVDLEFRGNCSRRPSADELRGELLDFIDRVRRQTRSDPVFYVTLEFLRAYGDVVPEGVDVWVRSVFLPLDRASVPRWAFWQFANHGRVAGISGPVDLDVFNGSAAEWKAFLARRGPRT